MDRLLGHRLLWLDAAWPEAAALRARWRGPLMGPWNAVSSFEELRRVLAAEPVDACLWHARALNDEAVRELQGAFAHRGAVVTCEPDDGVQSVLRAQRLDAELVVHDDEEPEPWIEAAARAIARGRRGALNRLEEDLREYVDAPGRMIGQGAWMQGVRDFVDELSRVRSGVAVVRADPGTGRLRLARAVASRRPVGRVVQLRSGELRDVAAERLLGSRNRPGVLELADGGTVLLESPEPLSRAAFERLRRYASTGEIESVDGAWRTQGSAVVLLAVSGEAAEARAQELDTIATAELPPLRERLEDLPALSEHFCRRAAALEGRTVGVAESTIEALSGHDWPGNLYELRQAIENAVARTTGERLEVRDLGYEVRHGARGRGGKLSFALPREGIQISEVLADLLDQALEMSGGNKTVAAELLGIHRDQVRYWVKKYSLNQWVRPRNTKAKASGQNTP